MTIAEIILDSGIGFLVILSLIQITPLKINPWSALVKFCGRIMNADLVKQLNDIEQRQTKMQETLETHIKIDDERDANYSRNRILQFNTEVMRHLDHTEEDFNQILADIDNYEKYCTAHPDYPNQRAVHAVSNIKRVYDKCLKENNFLT